MKNYVELRDKVITEVVNLVKIVYPDDKEMLSGVMDLTTELMVSDPEVDLVAGMRGFLLWAGMTNQENSKVLTTLIHDLGEWSRNGKEDWFSPRTSRYSKYLTGASEASI